MQPLRLLCVCVCARASELKSEMENEIAIDGYIERERM